ncbi:hypothetical protein LP420_33570 [Massilia sp. B-10]|nr:hypothetical protein LP420_33570 [Massilia sp. B-10]
MTGDTEIRIGHTTLRVRRGRICGRAGTAGPHAAWLGRTGAGTGGHSADRFRGPVHHLAQRHAIVPAGALPAGAGVGRGRRPDLVRRLGVLQSPVRASRAAGTAPVRAWQRWRPSPPTRWCRASPRMRFPIESLTRYSSHVAIVIAAGMLYHHLNTVKPHHQRRFAVTCLILAILGSGLTLMTNEQRTGPAGRQPVYVGPAAAVGAGQSRSRRGRLHGRREGPAGAAGCGAHQEIQG